MGNLLKRINLLSFFIVVFVFILNAQTYKFDFGCASVDSVAGYTKVTTSDLYTKAYSEDNTSGYFGFENWDSTHLRAIDRVNPAGLNRDVIVGWNNLGFSSYYFSVNVPEGKYKVTFYIGDYGDTATTTIKAESRRMLVENLHTSAGQIVTRTFTVMRRDTSIAGTNTKVTLDESYGREYPPICLGWDHKLTFEFSGARPCIGGLELVKIDTGITLHLCGNSTLVEQEDEPWTSWGQYVNRFFNSGIIVNDLAKSGFTSSAFLSTNRLKKICSVIKTGDFLFYEFGHNDSKVTSGDTAVTVSAYKANMKTYYDSAVAHGATMVFVTPTARHGDTDSSTSISGYAQIVRDYAKTLTGAKIIDLNSAVIHLNTALATSAYGSSSTQLYCYVTATSILWPDQPTISDGTHFCDYGGYELAKWITHTGMKAAGLGLGQYLLDTTTFNPDAPDLKTSLNLPFSLDTVYRHSDVGAVVKADSAFAVTVNISDIMAVKAPVSLMSISFNTGFYKVAYTAPFAGKAEFTAYSSNGKAMAKKIVTVNKSGSFDWKEISKLPAGMYLLKMKVNNKAAAETRFCKS